MSDAARELYSKEALTPLISPRSIAVIGASDRAGSLGARVMANLGDYSGAVFLISERLKEIGGQRCHASIREISEPVDCAVLAVPASAIEAVLEDCAAAKVRSSIIFASGYAELGTEEGLAAQERLKMIAHAAGMRLVGPNTTGIANLVSGAHCGFAEFPHGYSPRNGTIALVSQSGAIALGLSQAAERGSSLSHVLTAGNSVDVDIADYVSALADNETVDGIALVFEGLTSGDRLERAAAAAARAGKPIAVTKLGSSRLGAEAVAYHTASKVGCPREWSALFARCGMVEVEDLARLIETATFLAKFRNLPKPAVAPAVAILASSGGMGILAADAAERNGVATPQPSERTRMRLAEVIPPFGSPRNPCDATAQATSNPRSILASAAALLSDNRFDALVLVWAKAWASPYFHDLSDVAKTCGKPLCLVWMSQWGDGPGSGEAERLPNVALFRSLDSCMAAIRGWAGARGDV
ncbi:MULTISPECIES: CoA-binding protein [unclassified Chelatococcus]|uniref:CoA-binding protein n=1 Tax=unclassified Chelatococcus TaxID=2638111 RepID=UPI001BCA996A|nr:MULTISPECIES: CoA-binding protein [unclassified Chelatococcus]MBS7699960.1 CoA-binding protein [Chelatococcus sp. YT9]MBX3558615.1 CoA-binding protein [Chelatococcus sp.]